MSTQVKTDQPLPSVAISTDPDEKAGKFAHESNLNFEVVYGLSDDQARNLGLYISSPLASLLGPLNSAETYRPFAEPAMFFIRPDLEMIEMGIAVIQDKNYPVRGFA